MKNLTGLATFILLTLALPGPAQEWTRFRGPNGTGISPAKTVPTSWTEKDFNWKVPLPGAGHSSPVLWGDKIFLTSGDDQAGQVLVFCISAADGRVVWQKTFPFSTYPKHNYNSFASSSPAVDERRVYVCWGVPARCTLLALEHDGKLAWEKDLGPFVSQHGNGTSPIVCQDKVILGNEQDGDSFLIAVDAATGVTRWKTPRKTAETAYSTPCVYQPKEGKPALIFNSHAHGISALDPDNGKVLWEFASAFDKRSVSSPLVAEGLIIGSCGSGGGGNYVVAVRPGEPAKGKKPELAYSIRRSAPYVPTSVCVGERLFLWGDGGIVSCVQAATGEIKWQERVGGDFFGSPVWVDGRLFCVSSRGEVVVVEASDHFQVLARNPLGELTHSTPAVAGGRMYIHTSKHLISVGGGKEVSAKE
ncbi:MAG TPA: PQQ-binding-like beta-propeller repeat protein [Candidatus Binatia bacterium]|jgi:outer membrane protein assembly factor BamB|nr:PQQ-binding-like beta-propeller repeat protein [Candidatus Binatia bacterium]